MLVDEIEVKTIPGFPNYAITKDGRVWSKLIAEKIRVIHYLREVAKFTLADLAWQFDVTITTIWTICKRLTWKHI